MIACRSGALACMSTNLGTVQQVIGAKVRFRAHFSVSNRGVWFPSWRRRCAALLAIAVLAVGCADREEDRPQPGGVEQWRLVEDLRLDADAEGFSLVESVQVGSHGWIAVSLPQDSEVRIYDPGGRLASTVGRRGEGPGEFQHIGSLTWIADTLVIDDERLRRHTFVDLDGVVLRSRTVPTPFAEASATPRDGGESIRFHLFLPISAAPGNEALGIAAPMVPLRGPERVPAPRILVAISADGEARLIATPPYLHDERWTVTLAGRYNPVPFALRPLWAVSSNAERLVFASADQTRREGTFRVTMIELDGDTVFDRSYPFVGAPVTSAEADSAVATMTTIDRFQEEARQRVPEVHAPIEDIVPALDGTVWVTLRGPSTGREVMVLDSDGTPLALVALPSGSRVQDATRTHLYATETDAYGLLSVVRYRITGRD